ncbi:MAG: hypothetical protein ACXVFT_05240 [Solirubrobacteraceae bacterium]
MARRGPRRIESWRAAAVRRFAAALALTVAGLVLVALAGGIALELVGWTVFGLGLVLAVSFVFLEVGYSEDRERRRDAGR